MLHIGINGRSMFRQLTGVQHYTREVTRALLGLEVDDVRFTVFAGREGRRGLDEGLPVSASIIPAGGPLRGIAWEQSLLRRMIKKAGVDVIFNPANVAPLSPPAPSVVTVHDLAFRLFPENFSRPFSAYYRVLVPRITRQATAVIAVSENTRADLVEHLGLPPEKVTVVANGVSPEFRRHIHREELQEVRRRYRLPDNFFVSVASLEPRKNLQAIFRAYRLLAGEITSTESLVLVGAGNRIYTDAGLQDELQRARPGTVHALGYVPIEDLPAIYRLATALVYPSLYEGFGLPVLEAMASGTPVITSNRSSLPEVAGEAAILVNPESIEELAGAMDLIATDSGIRNLLVERGKKRAAGFSWEHTARKTLEVLRQAASGQQGAIPS